MLHRSFWGTKRARCFFGRGGLGILTLVLGIILLPLINNTALAQAKADLDDYENRLSIDDVLSMGAVGGLAAFDPDSRRLAIEIVRPYIQIGDYSYGVYSGWQVGHQIWLKDLDQDKPLRLLPALDPVPTSRIAGFSPNGRYLAVLQYQSGELYLSVCDLVAETCDRVDSTPSLFGRVSEGQFWSRQVVWTSEFTFTFPAQIGRSGPAVNALEQPRAAVIPILSESWASVERGDKATASVVESKSEEWSADLVSTWRDGPYDNTVMEYDVRTHSSHDIGRERLSELYGPRRRSPRDVMAESANGRFKVQLKPSGQAINIVLRFEETEQILMTLNEHLNGLDWAQKKTFRYSVSDPEGTGDDRHFDACVLLPPDFKNGNRYPLVMDLYPGSGPRCDNIDSIGRFGRSTTPHLWAARGFVYVRAPMPYDLIRTSEGPIAGMDEIAEQTADHLVNQGLVDPDRMVLFGFSQGGISSLYTATQTDAFDAVISMNGWANYFSHFFDSRGVFRYIDLKNNNVGRYLPSPDDDDFQVVPSFRFGVTPFEDPDVYIQNSPVFLAPKIQAPVMLVHSDLDYFSLNQYDEMFTALSVSGKDALYVRYWGEGHGPSSPANIRDLWERIDGFVLRHGIVR